MSATNQKTTTLPGLIDPHVHLRDPGQTHKEDFYSGTAAALAGGYTTILDMPNNAQPITTQERLEAKLASARRQIVCNVGFHFGTLGDNYDQFTKVVDQVTGLKVYMNVTTGNFIIDKDKLIEIYRAWPGQKPILLHAEDDVSELVLKTLKAVPTPTHICHVSSQAELSFVIEAKNKGLPITCGVTPHHLFLTNKDEATLGAYGRMKPSLKSQKDLDFIWNHLDAVDVIESDHAPHTKAEKDSPTPPFGVPGLETTLPLMLTAQQEGRLTMDNLKAKLSGNPAKIFGLKPDTGDQVTVDMQEYLLSNDGLQTKAGWTPFAGRRVIGKVQKVELAGQTAYQDGKVLAKPGSGQIINS